MTLYFLCLVRNTTALEEFVCKYLFLRVFLVVYHFFYKTKDDIIFNFDLVPSHRFKPFYHPDSRWSMRTLLAFMTHAFPRGKQQLRGLGENSYETKASSFYSNKKHQFLRFVFPHTARCLFFPFDHDSLIRPPDGCGSKPDPL